MSKEEIFNYFYTNSADLSIKNILLIMLAGLLIGSMIYITYWITYHGVAYNSHFNASLMVLLLISAVIMLMISSNIVISLGMVGALSIVRFRTAVKDSRDTVFIFWAIVEGLCIGSQNLQLAIFTTLFIGIVLIIFSLLPRDNNKYLLVVHGDAKELDTEKLSAKLKELSKSAKLRSATKNDLHQDIIFEVKTRRALSIKDMKPLDSVDGVLSVNWVAESGENVG